ncbi:MAG TPA: protein glxC, partial [Rhodospirillaceae bacterium]|nr:protein glxC [Rhodospirillaceae bacterium]
DLLVVEGNASSRCGISMKGIDIVVQGSVGHNSAFMAQSGHLVICGDADDGLGDSIYEAVIYLRGTAQGLGADCIEKEMTDDHRATLKGLLDAAAIKADVADFRRYGSARQLYNFKIDNVGAY